MAFARDTCYAEKALGLSMLWISSKAQKVMENNATRNPESNNFVGFYLFNLYLSYLLKDYLFNGNVKNDHFINGIL